MDRLQALEVEKDDLKVKMVSVPKKKHITAKEIIGYLSRYIDGDIQDEEFQRKLSRAFISEIRQRKDCIDVDFKVNDFIFQKTLGL